MASELEAAREKYADTKENLRLLHQASNPTQVQWDVGIAYHNGAAHDLVPALEAELSRTNALLDGALQWLTDNGYRAAVVQGRLVVRVKAGGE